MQQSQGLEEFTTHHKALSGSILARVLGCQLVLQCPSPSLCCTRICLLRRQGQSHMDTKVTPFCTIGTGSWGFDVARPLLDLISYCFSCRLVAKLSANTDTMPAPTEGTLLGASMCRIHTSQHCHRGLTPRSLITAA